MTEVLILDQITTSDCREIGIEKAIWTLSSAKPGNGIEQLRDGNLETFWQSDGAQPHCINIQFINKVTINKLCIYLDYNLDESYTPKKIGIRAGTCTHDLIDITSIELQEPIGWVTMILSPLNEVGNGNEPVYLRTHFLQIQVHGMHQNGRDTHMRQIKVFGPKSNPCAVGVSPLQDFQTREMYQWTTIR